MLGSSSGFTADYNEPKRMNGIGIYGEGGKRLTVLSLEDRLLSVRDVAEYLNVHPRTVYRMVDRDEIPVIRLGSILRFCWPDIAQLGRVEDSGLEVGCVSNDREVSVCL